MICKCKKTKENNIKNTDRQWKEKNTIYLRELQIFLDKVDNIEDSELRRSVINQMMICDKVLTEIAEDMFMNFYNEGYKSAKKRIALKK